MSGIVTKRFRHGNLLAEVLVKIMPDDQSWGPYLSIEDARKLDRVNRALKSGDIAGAAKEAKVFEVMALAGE